MPYALLTVDLDKGVTSDQRKTFNEEMANRHWTKMATTTTWSASFTAGSTPTGILTETKADVAAAASAAKVTKWECTVHPSGDAAPVYFKNP